MKCDAGRANLTFIGAERERERGRRAAEGEGGQKRLRVRSVQRDSDANADLSPPHCKRGRRDYRGRNPYMTSALKGGKEYKLIC